MSPRMRKSSYLPDPWNPHKSTRDPEERTHGPLRYNVATGKLTFGDSYHYKPDAEGLEVGGGFNTL